jgi:MoaA/NifB/PqqE/SkfB family radical SAM enzyme
MYSPFRHAGSILWKRRPIHLTFFLTRRCNSHCPFCFYLKGRDVLHDEHRELDLDEIGSISGSFGDLLWLAFSGGEIYLRDDLVEISRIFYKNNRPPIMLFPTNGLLPELIRERTERIVRDCPDSVIAVKLSLDGLGEDHDRLRNTPGSFAKTMETYGELAPLIDRFSNFELGINTVFCSENQDKMDEIIDFVNGMKKIKTHTISLIRGDLSEDGFKRVDLRKYRSAVERLEQNLKDKVASMYRFRGAKIKAAQDIIQRGLIHRTVQEKRRLLDCYAGKLNIVLTETGELFPCEVLSKSFGNIREHDLDIRKALATGRAAEIIRSIGEGECYCTHECYFMTNILFNPRLYPVLLREYWDLR